MRTEDEDLRIKREGHRILDAMPEDGRHPSERAIDAETEARRRLKALADGTDFDDGPRGPRPDGERSAWPEEVCAMGVTEEKPAAEAEARAWIAVVERLGLGGLLAGIETYARRYVVLNADQAAAAALWVAHTHAIDAAHATPYMSMTSPEKRSGKTRLLEALQHLVARPWFTGRVTPAVLARKVDAHTPTLLLDESDTAFGGDKDYAEALRGILNCGHRRGGAYSICVGEGASLTYKDFSAFSPKAIAGIGELPDTVADRAIAIRLKRRAPAEKIERYREREARPAAELLAKPLAAWAADEPMIAKLRAASPALPESISDRAADCWEPLIAIADLAGAQWPERSRAIAVRLSLGEGPEDETVASACSPIAAPSLTGPTGSRRAISWLAFTASMRPHGAIGMARRSRPAASETCSAVSRSRARRSGSARRRRRVMTGPILTTRGTATSPPNARDEGLYPSHPSHRP